MSLLDFVLWPLQCLPGTFDLLMGSWLVSKTKTPLRILFCFPPELPRVDGCPPSWGLVSPFDGWQSETFREVL